jgi:hypothetical protein
MYRSRPSQVQSRPRQPVAGHRFRWCLPIRRTPSIRQLPRMYMEQNSNAYQLVTAHHSHHAEGLDAILLRIERRARTIVSEHDEGVHLGVQIGDANLVVDDGVFETRLRLSIATAATSSVFASATLLAIAIDVHVDELLAVSVQIDDAGRCIFAVSECCS